MKNLILILVTMTALAIPAWAEREGGGGDPEAAAFSKILVKVAAYLEKNPNIGARASRSKMSLAADKIEKSLNQSKAPSLIEVTSTRPKDQFGVSKVALFQKSPLLIKVHGSSWRNLSEKEKVICVAMELLGIGGFENRYATARDDIGENYLEVLGKNVSSDDDLRPFPPHNPNAATYAVNLRWKMTYITRDITVPVAELNAEAEYSTDGKYCKLVIGKNQPVTCTPAFEHRETHDGILDYTVVGLWVDPKWILNYFQSDASELSYLFKKAMAVALAEDSKTKVWYWGFEVPASNSQTYITFGAYGRYTANFGYSYYSDILPMTWTRATNAANTIRVDIGTSAFTEERID